MMINITIFFFLLTWVYMCSSIECYLFGCMLVVFIYIYVLLGFNMIGMEFIKVGMIFNMDKYSFILVILTMWIIFICSFIIKVTNIVIYYINIIFFSLVMTFVSSSLYMFYVFFEFSLIPLYLLILAYGISKERVLASFYMFVYTMFGSIPSLFVMSYLMGDNGFISFDLYMYGGFNMNDIFALVFVVLFMIKVPIFVFHIWLPKAHVEAPVVGSMILASVVLKLGGFGMLRLMDMFDYFYLYMYVIGISMFGMMVMGIYCLLVNDFKVAIAYSSVIHMCLMMCGLISGNGVGFIGGLILMISHGICSSGLFMMSNYMYERSKSRLFFFNKGFIGVLSVFSFLWLLMVLGNVGVPPTISMAGEISSLLGLLEYCWFFFPFLVGGLFFIASYFMNIYMMVTGCWDGPMVKSLFVGDYLQSFFHLFPLNTGIIFLSNLL